MKKSLEVKIITLFPDFVKNYVESFGIVKRAEKLKLLKLSAVDLRRFGIGPRKTVDGRPYGGGVGMVLRPDVMQKAIAAARGKAGGKKSRVILLTPQGKRFSQPDAKRLAAYDKLVFVCGRYEGFDERVRPMADEELSLGDFVLMGGELAGLAMAEAVMRLRPGILGKDESSVAESFSETAGGVRLEYPQYTKPESLKLKTSGKKSKQVSVPKVLLTGHHENIGQWRADESEKRTRQRRPDLFMSEK